MRKTSLLCLGKDSQRPDNTFRTIAVLWERKAQGQGCFRFLGLEGAFGQLEDGRLFEEVGGGGLVQKF